MVQSREGCPHDESLRHDKWGVTAAGLHPALYLTGHGATDDFTTFGISTRTDIDRASVACGPRYPRIDNNHVGTIKLLAFQTVFAKRPNALQPSSRPFR